MFQLDLVDTVSQVQAATLPDVDGIVADVIAHALDYTAQKLGLRDRRAALARLAQGDHGACQFCTYSTVRHIAATIGAWDDHVRSVYVIDYDATPDDLCFPCDGRSLPVHVIVWTRRRTRALNALIDVLNRALTQQYRGLVDREDLEHVLDVQVIDDTDVQGKIGYGAMLASIHQRPIQVWSRQ